MAHHHRISLLFMAMLSSLLCSAHSYQFLVGSRDGWVLKPSEGYNHWASRLRFQVNDTLLFKYDVGSDSVVVVNKDDYDKCNADNPITKFDDGNSVFTLNRSGPFYFITGNKSNCDHGQKLIVVVLAIRTPPSPSTPLLPPPTASPPQGSSSSVTPAGPRPAASPSPSSPVSSPPSLSPGSVPAGASPGASPAGGPGSSTPADADAPTSQKGSLAAPPPCSSCVFLMSAASLVLSVGVFV